jgi:hypothetical protein
MQIRNLNDMIYESNRIFSTDLYFAKKRRTPYQLYLYYSSIRNGSFHNCSSLYHSKQLILSHSESFILLHSQSIRADTVYTGRS